MTTFTFTELPWRRVRDLLKAAVIPATTDTYTPVLQCVRLSIQGDTLTLTATDRFRLGEVTVHGSTDGADTTVLLHRSVVTSLARWLPVDGPSGSGVTLTVDDEDVTLRQGRSSITMPTTEDLTYPPVDKLWPTETVTDGKMSAFFIPSFLEAGMRAMRLATTRYNSSLTFGWQGAGKAVALTADGEPVSYRYLIMPRRPEVQS